MKKVYNPNKTQLTEILKRPSKNVEDVERTVNQIFREVNSAGDEAVRKYTALFDGASPEELNVTSQEIEIAENEVSEDLKKAIQLAKSNIESFHAAQKTERIKVETTGGVECWQEKRPIQKVGLYIPGGSAPLFSTILMLAIPARIAGCREMVLCTPPNKEGKINPVILYAAKLCGIEIILKVGGIQAIAGMTFGTESIPKVYKIFGPGNQFVTVAKQFATKYNVSIDMPAGPSELLVVADDSARAEFVASDLLSQAEHGGDSQVILISLSETFVDKVELEVQKQLRDLPRKDIAEAAIENSRLIYIDNKERALKIINDYAPEHFIVCTDESDFFVNGIENAGSVFIGNNTPESAGDYASGTNHTLPTNGYAKQYSGVNLDSFLKTISFQKISEEGIQNIGPAIELMAEAEGLEAHKKAVTYRLEAIKNKNSNE